MEDGIISWICAHPDFLYVCLPTVLIFCGMGLPIPEEIIFITFGYIGQQHNANVIVLCLAGLIGIMLGDSIPFFIGHHYGMKFLTRPWPAKLVKPHYVEKTKLFFAKWGSMSVFIARFLAGLRMPTFFMAGAMCVPFWKFFFWDFLGALISCPISIWLAYRFGRDAERMLKDCHVYIFAAIGLVVAFFIFKWWRNGRGKPPGPPAAPAETPVIVNASATPDQAGPARAAALERAEAPKTQ